MSRFVSVAILLASVTAYADTGIELEAGGTVGGDRAMTHEAAFVDGEVRITPIVSFHGQLTDGHANSPMALAPNVYMQLRGGIDAHMCSKPALCFVAGIDAAFMTESYVTGRAPDGLGDTWDTIEERGGFAMIPRLALDLGSDHWRVRPGVEATLSKTINNGNAGNTDLVGIAATLGVARRF